MSQKGFVPVEIVIFAVIGVAAVIGGGISVSYLAHKQIPVVPVTSSEPQTAIPPASIPTSTPTPTPVSTPPTMSASTPTPTPTSVTPTVPGWNTYRNKEYEIEFQYPSERTLRQSQSAPAGTFVSASLQKPVTGDIVSDLYSLISFSITLGGINKEVLDAASLIEFRSQIESKLLTECRMGNLLKVNLGGGNVSETPCDVSSKNFTTNNGTTGLLIKGPRSVGIYFTRNNRIYTFSSPLQLGDDGVTQIAKTLRFIPRPASPPPAPPTPVVVSSDWGTYRDEDYFYEFRYPPNMKVRKVGSFVGVEPKVPTGGAGLGNSTSIDSSPFRNYSSIYGTETINSFAEYYQRQKQNCEKGNQQYSDYYEQHRADLEKQGIAKKSPEDCEAKPKYSGYLSPPVDFVTSEGVKGEMLEQAYQGTREASSVSFVANNTLYTVHHIYDPTHPENAEHEREVFFQIVKTIRFLPLTQGVMYKGVIVYGCGNVTPSAENCASSQSLDSSPKNLKIENTVTHGIQNVTTGVVPFRIKLDSSNYNICIGTACMFISVRPGVYVDLPFLVPRSNIQSITAPAVPSSTATLPPVALPNGLKTYRNDQSGFEFQYPQNLVLYSPSCPPANSCPPGNTSILFQDANNYGEILFNLILTTQKIPHLDTFEDFKKATEDSCKERCIPKRIEEIKTNAGETIWLTDLSYVNGTIPGDSISRNIYFKHGDYFVGLTYYGPSSGVYRDKTSIDIAKTFRFLK